MPRPARVPSPERSTPVALWSAIVAASLGLAALAAWAALGFDRGPRPAFLDPPAEGGRPTAVVPKTDPGLLELAGSGSNLPLTRALAEAYMAGRPGARVVVHESIGSTGGVLATLDGLVDVGLVSRPVREDERARGVHVVPYARVAVVFAAHPSVPDTVLAPATVLALYGGESTAWPDGSAVRVLLRESGDSGHAAVARVLPQFTEVTERAYREGRWPVLYQDLAMQQALLTTPGALGVFDRGAIRAQNLPLKVLALAGTEREPAKDLAFVTAGPPAPEAARFMDFVASPAGRALTERLGYVPIGSGA